MAKQNKYEFCCLLYFRFTVSFSTYRSATLEKLSLDLISNQQLKLIWTLIGKAWTPFFNFERENRENTWQIIRILLAPSLSICFYISCSLSCHPMAFCRNFKCSRFPDSHCKKKNQYKIIKEYVHFWADNEKWGPFLRMRGGLMVSSLDFGSSGLGSSPSGVIVLFPWARQTTLKVLLCIQM